MGQLAGTSPFTDFDPANYVWAPKDTDIWANGDGQFVYPGSDGPVSTVRLEVMRDGLEDWEVSDKTGLGRVVGSQDVGFTGIFCCCPL